jgi:hypothetical protein
MCSDPALIPHLINPSGKVKAKVCIAQSVLGPDRHVSNVTKQSYHLYREDVFFLCVDIIFGCPTPSIYLQFCL